MEWDAGDMSEGDGKMGFARRANQQQLEPAGSYMGAYCCGPLVEHRPTCAYSELYLIKSTKVYSGLCSDRDFLDMFCSQCEGVEVQAHADYLHDKNSEQPVNREQWGKHITIAGAWECSRGRGRIWEFVERAVVRLWRGGNGQDA